MTAQDYTMYDDMYTTLIDYRPYWGCLYIDTVLYIACVDRIQAWLVLYIV